MKTTKDELLQALLEQSLTNADSIKGGMRTLLNDVLPNDAVFLNVFIDTIAQEVTYNIKKNANTTADVSVQIPFNHLLKMKYSEIASMILDVYAFSEAIKGL
jgi:hypothetical protein